MTNLGNVAKNLVQSKDYLKEQDGYKFLNSAQFNAVTYGLGSFLVLAGAGTGKTSVLINRFRYLIDELSVDPAKIMAVTFTNKAAKEIRNRLFGVFKNEVDKVNKPVIGTFHSICLRMLRDYSRYAGIAQNYTIWDVSDMEDKMIELAKNGYPRPKGYLTQEERELEEQRGFVPLHEFLTILLNAIDNAREKVNKQIISAKNEDDLRYFRQQEMRLINVHEYYKFLNLCAQGKKTFTLDSVKYNVGRALMSDISFFKENGWSSKKATDANQSYYDVEFHPDIGHYIPSFMFNRFDVDKAFRYLALVIYRDYELYSRDNHLLDFSDLLMLTVDMLEKYPHVREMIRNDFDVIMVDEFQDTNMLQYRWLKLIAGEHTSVMVVGDDDQSIYGWRGAHPEYMQYFLVDFAHPLTEDFSETTHLKYKARQAEVKELDIIRLEQNYRSTVNVLSAANEMINLNKDRLGKTLFTKKTNVNPFIDTIVAKDEFALAKWIGYDIKQKIQKSIEQSKLDPNVKPLKFDDFAVLYRTNQLGTKASSIFSQLNIPHVVYGGYNFYQRKEVKSALEWLNFVLDMENDLLFTKTFKQIPPTKRVNPFNDKVGFVTSLIDELEYERDRSSLSRYVEALSSIATRFENEVAVMTGDFSVVDIDEFWVSPYATTQGMITSEFHHNPKVTKVAQSIADYAKYLEKLLEIIANNKLSLYEAVFQIWKSCGLWDFYEMAAINEAKKEEQENLARSAKSTNAKQVGDAKRSFQYINDLLEQISSWEKDQMRLNADEYSSMLLEDKLLAYLNDVMLYTDKEEGRKQEIDVTKLMTLHSAKGLEFKHVYLFGVSASIFPAKFSESLEEERRLFYVGITRAREHLTIAAFGQKSIFFDELEQYSFAVLNDLGTIQSEYIDALIENGGNQGLPYKPDNKISSGIMSLQKKNADQVISRHQKTKKQDTAIPKTQNRLLGFLAK